MSRRKNRLPSYPTDENEDDQKELEQQLKQCQQLNGINAFKDSTHRLKAQTFLPSHSQLISSKPLKKKASSHLTSKIKVASMNTESLQEQSVFNIFNRYAAESLLNAVSHKNLTKRTSCEKRTKKNMELKDVIMNRKINQLKEQFCNKIRRNNPFSAPVQFDLESDASNRHFFDRQGINFSDKFQNLINLLYVYNTASSIFIYTLSNVFPNVFYLIIKINDHLTINLLEIIGLVIFFIQMALNFITIKYTLGKKLQKIKEIGQDYIRHKFSIDCASFLIIIVYMITRQHFLGYFRLAILLKIPDCMQKIQKLEVYFIENNYKEHYWSLIKVFLFNFCFAHMLAILLIAMSKANPDNNWLAAKDLSNAPWFEQYVWSYYWGTTIMLTIGFGDLTPACYQEALCMIFIETISCMVLTYNINCVGSLISEIRSQDIAKSKDLKIFKKIVDKHNLSESLSWKINNYIEEHTNIKKLFSIQQQVQFVQKLPIIFRTDYLKQANKKIFCNLFFFARLMERTLFSLAQKIEMKITHPQEMILTHETNFDVLILKDGQVGYISRKINRKFNKHVFDKIQVQQNKSPFLLNTNFITKKRANYGIKSLVYSVLYSLKYQNLIESLLENHLDYQLFCRLRDKSMYKLDQFSVVPCQFCEGVKHTKFSCPKIHFMPIEQHVLNKYLYREKVGRNPRVDIFFRNQIPKQSSLVKFLNYKDIYDEKKKQQSFHLIGRKFKKQEYVIEQLKAPEYDLNVQKTFKDHNKQQHTSGVSLDIMTKFQSTFLETASEIIEIQINKALAVQKGVDDVWLLDIDRMKNYKDYFPQNNPCNLALTFDIQRRIINNLDNSAQNSNDFIKISKHLLKLYNQKVNRNYAEIKDQ